MTLKFVRNILIAVAVATSAIAAAPPAVSLDIKYQAGNAPFTTHARVHITPNPANRAMCLQWTQVQGGGEQRTSCIQLDGETAPKTHWQYLKDLSSGKWSVVAVVIRNDDSQHLSNPILLRVFGPNYQSDPLE